jgi:hypothetical protein
MTARLIGVCTNCQENKHGICMDEATCVCAMRQHPDRTPIANYMPKYVPQPGA